MIAWHDAGNNTINIQVNNGTVKWLSHSAGATDTSNPLSIGALPGGSTGLNGRIDEMALYNRVLSAAERAWLYNGGKGRTYSDVSSFIPPAWHESKYMYSASIPHAVSTVNRGSFTDSFTYDENGNMTCRTESSVTYIQTYNAENRIASIQKLASGTCIAPGNLIAKWDFTYDGDGVRTAQSYTAYTDGQPGTPVFTRYYFGGAYETAGNTWKKYYSFAGQTVAMRDETGLKYFLTDHLSSIAGVTDDNGTLISQQRYLPFGQVRTDIGSIAQTDFGYTGQRKLDDGMGGIMDYKARFYSPYLNRFLQPDTIVPSAANPQSWNRYSYVLNSPVNHTDPTGHYCVETDENGNLVHVDCETGDNNDDPDDELSGGAGGGDGNGGDPTPDVTNPENPLVDILETVIADDFQALVDNDCFTETPGTIDWSNSKCVDAVSFAFQDLATGLSSASASWTAILTVLGCAPSSGVGCGAGYLLGVADHVFFFNPLESTASLISFSLTAYSDYLTQDTSLVDWRVGEDTKTGLVTFVAGLLTVEPFFDAGIDLYASGYNHGYFCGISTVASCTESMISGFP